MKCETLESVVPQQVDVAGNELCDEISCFIYEYPGAFVYYF